MASNYQIIGRHARHPSGASTVSEGDDLSRAKQPFVHKYHDSVSSSITDTSDLPDHAFAQNIANARARNKRHGRLRSRSGKGGLWSRLWVYELLAAVLSQICIIVIIAVLLYEDGKRLDQWAFAISPNAAISFIAALAKASCVLVLTESIGQLRWLYFASAPRSLFDLQIFDAASRGPVGGINLVARRPTAAIMASCASILTIFALFMEPFAQLIVNVETQPTPSDQLIASMRVAKAYYAGTPIYEDKVTGYFEGSARDAPFAFQAAVTSAAFGLPAAFDVTCPTSNCTFPPLSTLGICSLCEDMSQAVVTVCDPQLPFCNTTVPGGLIPGTSFEWRNPFSGLSEPDSLIQIWNSSPSEVAPRALDMAGTNLSSFGFDGTPSAEGLALVPGEPAVIAAVTTLKTPPPTEQANGTETPGATSVYQCRFTYCQRTYNDVRIQGGQLNVGSVEKSELMISSNGSNWSNFTGDIPRNTTTNEPILPGSYPIMTMQRRPGEANYSMSFVDYLNIAAYMKDIFNDTMDTSVDGQFQSSGGSLAPMLFALAMYNTSDFSSLMSNISDAMTNSFRTSQYNLTTVNGTALEMQTFIHIEWKWLALPIAVTTLSLNLLIIVILQSRQSGVEAWKSSSIPLLFYGLEGFEEDKGEFRDAQELKDKTRKMEARMLLSSEHRVFVNARPRREEMEEVGERELM